MAALILCLVVLVGVVAILCWPGRIGPECDGCDFVDDCRRAGRALCGKGES